MDIIPSGAFAAGSAAAGHRHRPVCDRAVVSERSQTPSHSRFGHRARRARKWQSRILRASTRRERRGWARATPTMTTYTVIQIYKAVISAQGRGSAAGSRLVSVVGVEVRQPPLSPKGRPVPWPT